MDLKAYIRNLPDFPQKGVLFRDLTPLMGNAEALEYSVRKIAEFFKDKHVNKVAAIEARGLIFGAPIAMLLNAGFVPVRKPGKLPFEIMRKEFQLEYGS
jgi:adenine phosphoribosyltransferase